MLFGIVLFVTTDFVWNKFIHSFIQNAMKDATEIKVLLGYAWLGLSRSHDLYTLVKYYLETAPVGHATIASVLYQTQTATEKRLYWFLGHCFSRFLVQVSNFEVAQTVNYKPFKQHVISVNSFVYCRTENGCIENVTCSKTEVIDIKEH